MQLLCSTLGHAADWNMTNFNGFAWIGPCKRCRQIVSRQPDQGQWSPAVSGAGGHSLRLRTDG